MIFIILAIIFSIAIGIIFKFFDRYNIDHFQAIVFNYVTCVVTGCLEMGSIPFNVSMLEADWLPIITILGLLFISGFFFVGKTVQYFGIAIASVAQRMSIGLSVPFSIWFYNDPYTSLTIVGIIMALCSVVLINVPAKVARADSATEALKVVVPAAEKKVPTLVFLFPILALLISVFIEIILQYLHVVHEMKPAVESIVLFGFAGLFGFVGIVLMRQRITFRNFIAGIILGVPNYFSIYFLLRSLETWKGSIVYSVNNISVVAIAAILGYFLFKERLTRLNALGIVLALMASYLLVK